MTRRSSPERQLSTERSPFLRRAMGATGLAIAALPLAAYAGFSTTEIEKTLPVAGERTFTISPSFDRSVTGDFGPHGKIAIDIDSPIGATIKVGSIPIDQNATSNKTLHSKQNIAIEALNSLFSLNEESIDYMTQSIKKELLIDFAKRTAIIDLSLTVGAYLASRKFTKKEILTGLTTAIALLGVAADSPQYAENSNNYATVDTSYGTLRIYDKLTADLILTKLPSLEEIHVSQVAANEAFVASVSSQLDSILGDIRAAQPENTTLVEVSSDIHTTSTMLDILTHARSRIEPDLVLNAGDLTNYDSEFELFVAKKLNPDVIALGNHDGPAVREALLEAGALLSEEPSLVNVPLADDASSINILTAEDPRYTAAGTKGTIERTPGAIEAMRSKLLEIASENDIDIILLHEPSDVQFLIDNGIAFDFAISGHTHKAGVVELPGGRTWLQVGTTGGIASRTVASVLTPLTTPSKEATYSYAALDDKTGELRALYTITITPEGKVHLSSQSYDHTSQVDTPQTIK